MATNATTTPSVYFQDKAEIKKVFNRLNINNDGKISSSELVDVMRTLGSDTSSEEVTRMMSEIDTDKDGFISLDEFTDFLHSSAHSLSDDDADRLLRDVFSLYDQNKNGLISAVELHQILINLGERCTVQDCGKIIVIMFTNFVDLKCSNW